MRCSRDRGVGVIRKAKGPPAGGPSYSNKMLLRAGMTEAVVAEIGSTRRIVGPEAGHAVGNRIAGNRRRIGAGRVVGAGSIVIGAGAIIARPDQRAAEQRTGDESRTDAAPSPAAEAHG